MPVQQNRKSVELWRHARINRFVDRQRQLHQWIRFADVTDYCAREANSITPDEAKRARAYDELADAVIKGEFDKDGKSRVLFLHPLSRKARMTWEMLSDVIQFDLDGDRAHDRLSHCWASREMMKRWFDKRRLPKPPHLFEPPIEAGPTLENEPAEFGGNEYKRRAVDATILRFGVNALGRMSQKAREQQIIEFIKSKYGGLTVSDRFVRGRWLAPRNKEQKRS
jgi:hypothetical protein